VIANCDGGTPGRWPRFFPAAFRTVVGFPTAFALASGYAFLAAGAVAVGLGEPARTTPPPTDLGTVETTAGIAQLPGAHRGSDGD